MNDILYLIMVIVFLIIISRDKPESFDDECEECKMGMPGWLSEEHRHKHPDCHWSK
jgi:hypothetical protein